MRVTTLAGEATVGALADRLYADLTPESRRLAEAALLKDNPQLARPGGMKPGVVVRVPEAPELVIRDPQADPTGDFPTDLGRAVSEYQRRLARSTADARKDLADQSALLKNREVRAAVGKSEAAAQLAASLGASLSERQKALADGDKRLAAAFTQIARDLASLAEQGR